mmetsp:Transcript_77836/g.238152  ORF Transcript_77836/g.238152 Transcript_77836/m.238152 type:complete len:451 (-) Transcript_77836:56-1408(-)
MAPVGGNGGSGAAARDQSGEPSIQPELKAKLFRGVCLSWFFAVVAHTLNLQSEAILIRNACGGDLAKTARVVSNCNALAGILGIAVNQVGGRLSDSLGRSAFYQLGPIAQLLAGAMVFTNPGSLAALAWSKVLRGIFTTFSGTVMGSAGMRDCFEGQELGIKTTKAGSIIGLGIMVGPVIEGLILRRMKAGGERASYAILALLGVVNAAVSLQMPETLGKAKRATLDLAVVLRSGSPFGFLRIYSHGTAALKKLATVCVFQSMIDGKTMSDLTQIWLREHLKLSLEAIRNFVVSFGFLSVLSGAKLTPALMRRMSVRGFTTFTNLTNIIAFSLRGSMERSAVFFGVLPLMLPGVNGASSAALGPIVNAECVASGFGVGESSAWLSNLRAMAGVLATLIYGHFYAWCKRRGFYPGHTYAIAGLLGAAVPQALLSLAVGPAELAGGGAPAGT